MKKRRPELLTVNRLQSMMLQLIKKRNNENLSQKLKVIHSGIPVTLVPLDATATIPVTKEFFDIFKDNQLTYEAKYCYKSLVIAHDTTFNGQFLKRFSIWDAFNAGVAASSMNNFYRHDGENEFAEMKQNGIHSGHVQTGNQDPFCLVKGGTGRCEDGYTKEVSGPEGVRVLVAANAKPNRNLSDTLDRQFFTSLLDVLTKPQNSGRFNFSTRYSIDSRLVKSDWMTMVLH
ncbi:hypothetical protein POM88_026569 [Heracleum sosnowskyi]|uniref:Uncharacterized protein n=1 Tax=Heracleum sosnowskyi TaxID=360622 RepID=A0AAD8I9E8_9APIA|nr:hypothetical protein POM88_026569 [Heracleum sosnowskyi]